MDRDAPTPMASPRGEGECPMTEPIGARRSAVLYEGADHAETYEQCINRARADGSEWGGDAGMVGGCISGGYGGMAVGAALGGPPGAAVGALGGCLAGGIAAYFAGATAGAAIAETKAKVTCDRPERAGSPAASSLAAPSTQTPSSTAPGASTAPRPWAPPLALPEGESAPAPPASGGASCADGRSADDGGQCGPHASLTVSDFHTTVWA